MLARVPAPLRRTVDLGLLLILGVLLLLAARRAQRLVLDVEGESMRSATGADARAEERRDALFGKDATLVLLLERGADASDDDDTDVIDGWVEGLRALPEVAGVVPLASEEGERLIALVLHADEAGAVVTGLQSVTARAVATLPAGRVLQVSGTPAGELAIAEAMDAEQSRIVPLVGGVLLVLLLLVYRVPSLALGALFPPLGGIAITGAVQELLALRVNPVTSLLSPVLLAVGVASSVHVIDAYLEERRAGLDPEAATRSALRHIFVPALWCEVTTIIGFLALLTSPVPAVRRFGGLASAGVTATVLLSFLLLPAWLRVFSRSPRLVRRAAGHGFWHGGSVAFARSLARAAPALIAGALAFVALFGWGWWRMTVDTDPIGILPARHPFRIATDHIGRRLGGTETFDLLLEPPSPAGGLPALLALQQRLTTLDGVVGPAGVPRRTADGSALVSALLRPAGTTAREATFDAAEELARALGWKEAHATGMAVRMARDSGAIARGSNWGLAASFLAMVPCLWLALRSWPLTALGLAANFLPCALLYGGLGLLGRPLSVASAMIGSVVLGLVIDQAIYLLHGFREDARSSHARRAMARVLRRSGRALTVASLVLGLGFLAGMAGELTTTREFGVLAGVTIFAAWGANLLWLPAALLWLARHVRRAPRRTT